MVARCALLAGRRRSPGSVQLDSPFPTADGANQTDAAANDYVQVISLPAFKTSAKYCAVTHQIIHSSAPARHCVDTSGSLSVRTGPHMRTSLRSTWRIIRCTCTRVPTPTCAPAPSVSHRLLVFMCCFSFGRCFPNSFRPWPRWKWTPGVN